MFPEILSLMAEDLIALCRTKDIRVTTAESCTGGLLASLITSIPGSSVCLERGFVTYTNQAKYDMLGVPIELFTKTGAVSEDVATAMAKGALKNSSAHISVSITGIAGPDGGTDDKPVGLVHMAATNTQGNMRHERHEFKGDRDRVRIQAVESAMRLLLQLADQEEG